MKTLKRAIVGSFLALSVFAAPVAAVVEAEAEAEPVYLVYCLPCGYYHIMGT